MIRSLLLLFAFVLTLPRYEGVFVGGTFLGNYEHGPSFSELGAHSVNAGISFSLAPGFGVDVLPIVLGSTPEQRPFYGAAIFWRWYFHQRTQ